MQRGNPYGQTGMPIVLVVDCEVTIRTYFCDYLRSFGFLGWGVESADNAIRLLDLGIAADLVFSDVRMPGRYDGLGLARWICEHRPELPVILTTGAITRETALLCHAETLPKPYDLDSAISLIRQAIERHRTAAH
jgi:DNA-binding NtrC family response regulator